MHRILGTDLTEIDGVSDLTAHVFFTEVGPDLSKFQTVNYFASWLGLCPNNKVSGGKGSVVSHPARIEPTGPSASAFRQLALEQQILPWRLFPTSARPPWSAKGDYGHSSQAGPDYLSSHQKPKGF